MKTVVLQTQLYLNCLTYKGSQGWLEPIPAQGRVHPGQVVSCRDNNHTLLPTDSDSANQLHFLRKYANLSLE